MTDKINIIIPLEGGRKWQKEFNPEDKIEKVAEIFKKENNMEFPEQYIMNLKYQNRQININDPVKTLVSNNKPNLIFDINLEQNGLNLKNNKMINFELLGKPISDPFQIHVYDKKEKKIRLIYFDKEEIKNTQIGNYNNESAYCNGNNHLYISGGENKQSVILNNFWDIDLKNETIEKIPNLIEPKKNHSMIYIISKIIFIVGGNTKKTFYYDIENKAINNWANLNIERTEPALIQFNDYLYCFENFKRGDNEITFEKTNLKENPKWEIIKPIFEENFNQKFFGVSKYDNENIIFFGGYIYKENQNDKLMNFQYNITNNTVSKSQIPFIEMNLSEKNCYKIDTKKDLIIPEYRKEEPEIIVLNKKSNKINKVTYEFISYGNKKKKKPLLLRNVIKNNQMNYYNYNMPIFDINGIEKIPKSQKFNFDVEKEKEEEEDEDTQNISLHKNNKRNLFQSRNISNIHTRFNSDEIGNKKENIDNSNIISTSKSPMRSKIYTESTFSGNLLRNSVIKNNTEGNIKYSEIPKIKKKVRPIKSEQVKNSGDFDKNQILGLKSQSVNIGIGGKKDVI